MKRAVVLFAILLFAAVLPIVLPSAAPAASAQLGEHTRPAYAFDVRVDKGFDTIRYMDQTTFRITLRDLSRDDTAQQGREQIPHYIRIEDVVIEGTPLGWIAQQTANFWITGPGAVVHSEVIVTAGAPIQQAQATVVAIVSFQAGEVYLRDEVRFAVQVEPFIRAGVLVKGAPPTVKQFGVTQIPIELINGGVYPQKFLLNASAPDGWKASIVPEITLNPNERRTVNMSVQAPVIQTYEFGRQVLIGLEARPYNMGFDGRPLDLSEAVYAQSAVVQVQGWYVRSAWKPLFSFILLALAILTVRMREQADQTRHERGVPRPVMLTPKQRALLSELRRRDPEAYKARVAQLAAIAAARRATYRGAAKDRMREERLLLKQERREAAEERKRRKAEAQARAAEEKERRAALRKLEAERAKKAAEVAKLRAAQEKVDAKEAAKREKELLKRRKVLERERAKKGKVLAKERKRAEKAASKTAKRGGKGGS